MDKKNLHYFLMLVLAVFSVSLSACGDDDDKKNEPDEPSVEKPGDKDPTDKPTDEPTTEMTTAEQLMSSSWEMVDDGDGGDMIESGSILTFEKNGTLSVIPQPDEVEYAKWEVKGSNTLTITVNFGDPLDDYLIGNVEFVGDKCIFTFKYYEQDHFDGEGLVMTLKKIK